MVRKKVTSAGHKLGQLVGDWYEEYFVWPLLKQVAAHLKLYLDCRFSKRTARTTDKIIWIDEDDNAVDYDFVMELDGTDGALEFPLPFSSASGDEGRAIRKTRLAMIAAN